MSAAALKLLKIRERDMRNRLGEIGGVEMADYTDEVRSELKAFAQGNGDQRRPTDRVGNVRRWRPRTD